MIKPCPKCGRLNNSKRRRICRNHECYARLDGDMPLAAPDCSLSLNASGTPNQLAVFLRNAANQIEHDAAKSTLPWFYVGSGSGFMGDFKVVSANVNMLPLAAQPKKNDDNE